MIEASLVVQDDLALWLERERGDKQFALLASTDARMLEQVEGHAESFQEGFVIKHGSLNRTNAAVLREVLPHLRPLPLGLATSAGFGDRLGLATPGHARALQQVLQEHSARYPEPIFAQQSIREMTRTHRTPSEVLDDATWGAFEAGWRGRVGADADHLKTTADIDRCAAEGYSFYTIDPGEYVDDSANAAEPAAIETKLDTLPWETLQTSLKDLKDTYVGSRFSAEDLDITLDEEAVLRAAAKYSRAIAHVASMYQHLASKGIPFEFEVSVDETESHTSHAEHIFIAMELKRLGVEWVSLAPRFVGRFEKGVDYRGDLAQLEADLNGHAVIARALGPYKLSLHSGSDKFSVYPLIQKATRGLVHLKTAGTSYLEALRVVAMCAPSLFREIAALARARYEEDKRSYHVSADLSRVPKVADVADKDLVTFLDQDDARQVLHVTFGSVLDQFRPEIVRGLQENEQTHYEMLERHFKKHLEPFVGGRV
jgi:hypothetical protein